MSKTARETLHKLPSCHEFSLPHTPKAPLLQVRRNRRKALSQNTYNVRQKSVVAKFRRPQSDTIRPCIRRMLNIHSFRACRILQHALLSSFSLYGRPPYIKARPCVRSTNRIWSRLYFKVWNNTIDYTSNDIHCLAFCPFNTHRCIHPIILSRMVIIYRTRNDLNMFRKQIPCDSQTASHMIGCCNQQYSANSIQPESSLQFYQCKEHILYCVL